MDDPWTCKKSNQRIQRANPECPSPKGPCKYRAECLIYAFEQLEKMDSKEEKSEKMESNQSGRDLERQNEDIS